MKPTDKRVVLRKIRAVEDVVTAEIATQGAAGKFSAGLASEGYAGGYLDALRDMDAALRHGCPADNRGYWRRANIKPTKS